jgi:predicted PurR-regulated permease PerM
MEHPNENAAPPKMVSVMVAQPEPQGSPAPVSRVPRLGDFPRRVLVTVLITVLVLALSYLMWRGIHVLLQAFAGALFAVFLATLSDWLSKRTGIRYGWSLTLVVVALLALTAGFGWLLANRLSSQATELTHKLPESLQQIRDYLMQFEWGQRLVENVPNAGNTLAQAGEFSRVTGLISGVANFLVTAVVILFVGIFGAAEPDLYRAGLLHLVPTSQRRRVGEALDALVYNLRWWLVGQFVLMIMMWITTTVGLWLLGVPLALTLGLIAGVFELVPYIGPWISAIPAAMVALLLGPSHLIGTLALYLVLHILEGYVMVPLVQRRAVHIPPALTLVAQVLLGELLGLLGLFVAAPLTVCAIVLLKMLYVEDTLGDQAVEVPGEKIRAEKKDTARDGLPGIGVVQAKT